MANDTVYDGLKQFRNRRKSGRTPGLISRVLVHDLNKGGHLSAQPMGALKNYIALDPETGRPAVEHFPIRKDNPHRIEVEGTKRIIERTQPELIIFGRSVIIQTEPVKEIADFVFDLFGKDNPQRPLIMFDGAHVLGLLGPHYQDPLAEGADFVTGSTHKTFFGPQRGVILSNITHGSPFEELWGFIESRAFPGHVSNHHLGTLLGLLGAAYEMLRFKDEYPKQVIANAKAFARALSDQGLEIEGDPACGFTETHQVLLRTARARRVRGRRAGGQQRDHQPAGLSRRSQFRRRQRRAHGHARNDPLRHEGRRLPRIGGASGRNRARGGGQGQGRLARSGENLPRPLHRDAVLFPITALRLRN
jgi:glycine/serine hydroxymethyltransferase